MYQILSFITGVILSFMITINGGLSEAHGLMASTVIIHVVGTIVAFALCLIRREKLNLLRQGPLWFYLGGAIGLLTVVFQNYAFSHISTTSIIALGLFGQTVASVIYDRFGLMGMPRRPFEKSSVIGFVFAIAGILYMLDPSVKGTVLAVILAIASGITIVVSRTVNTRLSDKIGAMPGSLVNHAVGLPFAIILLLVSSGGIPTMNIGAPGINPIVYFGGVLGVFNIYLLNVTVPKLSAFRLTVLTFIGQILSSVLIDLFSGRPYSQKSLVGGLIIAAGVILSIAAEQFEAKKSIQNRKS